MNGFCVRSVPSEGILSSVHPQTQPVLFCVVCPDPQPLNCRLTFDPVLYLMIPQSCQGPEGRSGAWVRITWPTPWGCCHGDCIWHTTHEISCSWLARCLTQWFPLQTNHIGFYWAGWKIPLLFHWDTGLKFCHAVRLNSMTWEWQFWQHRHPQTLLFNIAASPQGLRGIQRSMHDEVYLSKRDRDDRTNEITKGIRSRVQTILWYFPDIRGSLTGQEARQAGQTG